MSEPPVTRQLRLRGDIEWEVFRIVHSADSDTDDLIQELVEYMFGQVSELDRKIGRLSSLLADPIEVYQLASDEICESFLAYLIDNSVGADTLVRVVKLLAQ